MLYKQAAYSDGILWVHDLLPYVVWQDGLLWTHADLGVTLSDGMLWAHGVLDSWYGGLVDPMTIEPNTEREVLTDGRKARPSGYNHAEVEGPYYPKGYR
jgi:hypothetical protein